MTPSQNGPVVYDMEDIVDLRVAHELCFMYWYFAVNKSDLQSSCRISQVSPCFCALTAHFWGGDFNCLHSPLQKFSFQFYTLQYNYWHQ